MGSCLSVESRSPLPDTPSSPSYEVRRRKSSKKRMGSRNSSFDYRREEQLHRIPGRMFLNGSSEAASLFTQQGKKGTNQDAMIVWELKEIVLPVVLLQERKNHFLLVGYSFSTLFAQGNYPD
ncbi:protein phosphatase 2C 33 [Pyrus ussuriensis x Pyrus communis]|uniref:Protein phosphatase 2C 33 n=1 Tax=Pyrus ussuriensis x Pyrus communis TaxID=2448454 RepID=A0A5N5HTD4_9ROSA|nr:protein phosphatase 2C 33 [Pyrus ussuriensis x Pyrus communis]